MTSPILPVSVNVGVACAGVESDSINRIEPPVVVHANPIATPGLSFSGMVSSVYISAPRSLRSSLLSRCSGNESSFLTIDFAFFRQRRSICLSKPRTPASRAQPLIIQYKTFLSNLMGLWAKPCFLSCFGNKKCFAISYFSSAMYPGIRMTSIRSSNTSGIVSDVFAVVMKKTFERSKGISI
jgi:hypothetical protein